MLRSAAVIFQWLMRYGGFAWDLLRRSRYIWLNFPSERGSPEGPLLRCMQEILCALVRGVGSSLPHTKTSEQVMGVCVYEGFERTGHLE